ncbi:hypothetical protein [Asticcacaulis sp. YBE204]|uniref:hypothetical protein n=1 Tax=Asticcacaulis sp. YBE204 TaxID=1282363 RepID=UPI0003C3E164|nr:hypothetical protein [Asticcacaulis sp. YBE204]ESQ76914.1 hypothetical protein AEYBE204_18735 [Asticcacaulis sp. YBE204]
MARDSDALVLQLSADIRRLQKGMEKGANTVDREAARMEKRAQRAAQEMSRSFGRAFDTAQASAQIAFLGIAAYSVKAASDAAELQSAFEVAFKESTKDAEAFAKTLADKVGRSVTDVKGQMTGLQLVLSGMGLSGQQALDIIQKLTARAVDIGSLFNVSDAEAMQAVISGITGETEPLKRFGAVINEAAVKAELLRLGFKGNAEQAPEAAKAIARTNLILQKTAVAAGDAERTQGSLANQTKRMQGDFKDAAIALGNSLLPAMLSATKTATGLTNAFTDLPEGVQLASLALLGLVAASGPISRVITGMKALIAWTGNARIALAGLGAIGVAGLSGATALLADSWMSQAATKEKYDLRDKVLANPNGATDEDLAKALAVAKSDREMAKKLNGDVKGKPVDQTYQNLLAEQRRRQADAAQTQTVMQLAAQRREQTKIDAESQGALALLEGQKVGVGGAAKTAAKAGATAKTTPKSALATAQRSDFDNSSLGVYTEDQLRTMAILAGEIRLDTELFNDELEATGGVLDPIIAKQQELARQAAYVGQGISYAFGDAIARGEDFGATMTRVFQNMLAEWLALKAAGFLGVDLEGGGVTKGGRLDKILSKIPSFDGGGSTGNAARAGGLDGKGGFLAMMHPRENVTDFTRNMPSASQMGRAAPTMVNQSLRFDMKGAVVTEDLLSQMQRMASRAQETAIRQADRNAGKSFAGRVRSLNTLGTVR